MPSIRSFRGVPTPRRLRVAVTASLVAGSLVLSVEAITAPISARPIGGASSLLSPTTTTAAAPALATVASTSATSVVAFDSNRAGSEFEIFTMAPDGSGVRQLTSDARYDSWWPQLSPDRTKILYYRTPVGGHDQSFTKAELWVMNVDGSAKTVLRPAGTNGWEVQAQAQWSPSGSQLVMTGGANINPQVFVTDSLGRNPRQVTNRGGVNVDPSWSPDGTTIAFVGCPVSACYPTDYEIYKIPAAGGTAVRLTNDKLRDQDPQFSPDGTRVAWLTQTAQTAPAGAWNIRVAAVDGSGAQWVTNDSAVNSKPNWSRDGALIWFHRLDTAIWPGFNIYNIRPDGTGLTLVARGPGSNEYPSV